MWWWTAVAWSGDVVVVVEADAPPEVLAEEPDGDEPCEPRKEDEPRKFSAGAAVEFFDESLANTFTGRFEGPKDGYLDASVRVHPCCWTGRLGAGLDVFGGGPLDLTFGLFLGVAGENSAIGDRVRIDTAPQAGGQVAIGYGGRHLFTRYAWLAGWGGGPLDEALTENQFVVGFRLARIAEVYGEYLILDPGSSVSGTGIGLGARIVL